MSSCVLLAARGGPSTDHRSWFTGRTGEVNRVVSWVTSRERGVGARRPGVGVGSGNVHARGLTTDQVAERLDGQLVGGKLLVPAETGRRNAAELNDAEAARPASLDSTHAIVGTRQPTITTIRLDGHRAIPQETIGQDNDYGDATVPLAGGIRHGLALDTNRINRVADHHGNLQRNGAALDVLEGILTATPVVRRDAHATVELGVTVPELVLAGAALPVAVTTVAVTENGTARQAITITVRDEADKIVSSAAPRLRKGARRDDLHRPTPRRLRRGSRRARHRLGRCPR